MLKAPGNALNSRSGRALCKLLLALFLSATGIPSAGTAATLVRQAAAYPTPFWAPELSQQNASAVQRLRINDALGVRLLLASKPEYSQGDFDHKDWQKYSKHLRHSLQAAFSPPLDVQTLFCTVQCVIEPNGNISRIKLIQPAASCLVDDAAMRALDLANPAPPLPRGNGIRVTIQFQGNGRITLEEYQPLTSG